MATALDNFIHTVQTLSAQGNFRGLCDFLNKAPDLLVKNASQLDTVLEMLDLQEHSLGMLAVLSVKLSLPTGSQTIDEQEILFSQVQEFIINCNRDQIRKAPESFAELCHLLTRHLIDSRTSLRGLEVLSAAIRKLQESPSQLTLVHADICQLALDSKCFKPALVFLDQDISIITSQENVNFDTKYFLLYYYYGGMIYTALKKYDRGLSFFEVVIATPAVVVSHIMLEAYKKFVLVSLILHGKIAPMPKYTSQVVTRFIKPLSNGYEELGAAYATNSMEALRAVLTKYGDTFSRDGNSGLANQLQSSLYKKNIKRLTKTFLTLSLSDVAARVGLAGPEASEKYILTMIHDGEIFATINKKDGMVSFHDDPEKYNSSAMLARLQEEMRTCMELDRQLQGMEEEILMNPQYVKKAAGSSSEEIDITAQQPKISTYTM